MKCFPLFLCMTFFALAVPAESGRFDFQTLPKDSLRGELPDLEGAKLILIDFWASWCTPCVAALPYYDELQKKYKDRGVIFLSLSEDNEVKDAEKFLKKVSFSFPAFWDQKRRIAKALKVEAIPTLAVIAPNGKIIAMERGYTEKKKTELPKKIEAWLQKASALTQ